MARARKASRSKSLLLQLISGRLLQNAIALMLSAGGTAVLGVVFWAIAAHLASAADVGRAAAEIAAMVLLSNLSQLSFGSIFERFLPVAGAHTRSFVGRAYLMCITCALILATIYLWTNVGHDFIPPEFPWHLFFIAAVTLWTIFNLQDSAMIGLRASRWVPVENILFAVAKLAILPIALSVAGGRGIFVAWTVPVSLAIAGITWYLFRVRIPEHESIATHAEILPKTRELLLLAGAQYATLMFSVFTPSIMALIVIRRLGPVANAHYYVPALITTSLNFLNYSVARSFLVEAVSEPWALRRHAKVAVRAMATVLIPGVGIGVAFAPYFLRIFGGAYSADGTTLLRMLLLSLPLSSIGLFYSSFAWLDRHVWWMTIRDLISVVFLFAVTLSLINRLGLAAIGIATLVASGLQGAFFLPISIRRYRKTTNSEPHT